MTDRPGLDHSPDDAPRRELHHRRIAGALLLLVMIVVAVIVWWPGPPEPGAQHGLKLYLTNAHLNGLPGWISFSLIETLSNVVMFMPLGLLGAFALRRRHWLVVPVAALASGIVELSQLMMPGRVSSLGDVAANTAGALIGFLLAVPALLRRRRSRRRANLGRRGATEGRSPARSLTD